MLCFPKSISKHKKFTGKPSTKLPFPKLSLRASQEMATGDRCLGLPSSQTMVIAYQSLISSFLWVEWPLVAPSCDDSPCLKPRLRSDVYEGGTECCLIGRIFFIKVVWFLVLGEIGLLVLAGMLQFPLCVWVSEYVNVIFIKYWLLFSQNKQALQLLKKRKKKRQERYLLHYSFFKKK